MSEKSEELIEKTNSTSNIVSKRKLKLPTSVTEKKKDVNSNNIIPIESLKEKSLSSKKTKRTLHLNLGIEPEEIKEEVKSESSIEDENSITMIIPKISTKKDEKEKLMDTLLDIDDTSPVITPSSVASNKSFLDEPSVFEKYSIEISETDLTENAEEAENIVKENVKKEIVKKHKKEPVVNQNSIDDTTSLSLNDLISLDDETESIDDILSTEISDELDLVLENDNEIIQEENIESSDNIEIVEKVSEVEDLDALISQQKEYDVVLEENNSEDTLDDDLVNEIIDEDIGDIFEDTLLQSNNDLLIDELSDESNDINLLDLVENDEDLLKEVADNVKTPESTVNSAPIGILIENSGDSKNTDSSLFSKAKTSIVSNIASVFKKFSYDEAANLANSIEDENDENIVQNVNPVSDINQVLSNIEAEPQEKSVTELDVTADSIGLATPVIDEKILDISANENDISSLNILTPETTSSNLSDEELLDLLDLDTLSDDELEEKSQNIEESIPTDFNEEIFEDYAMYYGFASCSDCSILVLHFVYGKLQEDNLRYICFSRWKI